MTLIDWSDAEGLFDMLVEYVADAKMDAHADVRRLPFLETLLSQLTFAQGGDTDLPHLATKLGKIIESVDPDFADDPVMDHVTACLEELERIKELP